MPTSRGLRTFYTILITQAFSMMGSRISGLAIGFWLFAQTGEATPLVMVSFFALLPNIIATSLAGVLADRWSRRKVMILADFGQALCTLLLLISVSSGAFVLWHLYVLVGVQALFSALQGPAFIASVTLLVPESHRDRANAVQQMTGPLSGIIAPAIAGVLYSLVGLVGAILIDLATFAVAVAVMFMVHIPQPQETEAGRAASGSIRREVLAGFHYLWANKPLLLLVMHFSWVNFLIGGTMALTSPYILLRTGSEATLGVILSVMNVGGLIGGIVISIWGGTRPRIHTVMPGIIVSGVFLALYGMMRDPVGLGAVLFALFFPLPMVNALVMSILQSKIAPDLQGRVFAVLDQITLLMMPLAFLLVGPLADTVFEPAVLTESWSSVAPIVGSAPGAGIGLIYVIAGLLMASTSALVYMLPLVRRLESIIPDYAPVAAEPVDVPELTPQAPAIVGEA